MNFEFVLVKDRNFPNIDPWWACYINNLDSAIVISKIKSEKLTNAYMNIKMQGRRGHYTSTEECIIGTIFSRDTGCKTIVDDVALINKVAIEPLIQDIIRGNVFLLNTNWGMTPLTENLETIKVIYKQEFVFPIEGEQDIRIIKWKGGKHYYAKIGNQDVFINGKQKWDTYDETLNKAKEFLEINRKK